MRMRSWGAALAVVLALLAWTPAFAQSTTGTITGRAQDSSGGLLPGVTVSITSPSMIGGARTAVTDALGSYRFGQLPPGVYKVAFELTSFRTLTIENVTVNANATATVNGPLQLDTLEESITVTSSTPTIDLQNSEVAVNWSEAQMENLPYGRGIRGLARLVPGLTPTQFDVGGNTVGGSTTTGPEVMAARARSSSSSTASCGTSSSATTTPTSRCRSRAPPRAPRRRARASR